MHQWILILTEAFDLTFAIADQHMSIVPCMLPEREPATYVWPELNENDPIKIREMKILYNFDYVPNGLFNRAQVRLYELSNSSIIWKKGSFLTKNNHIALFLNKPDTRQIQLKVQGVKPENIVFVIHEVIESLIKEVYLEAFILCCPSSNDFPIFKSRSMASNTTIAFRAFGCQIKAAA